MILFICVDHKICFSCTYVYCIYIYTIHTMCVSICKHIVAVVGCHWGCNQLSNCAHQHFNKTNSLNCCCCYQQLCRCAREYDTSEAPCYSFS